MKLRKPLAAQGMATAIALILLTLFSCTSSRQILKKDLKRDQSVKVFTRSNQVLEGLVIKSEDATLEMISAESGEHETLPFNEIRRIEHSEKIYDYSAKPISRAEIEKFKGSRNTFGYAAGGAAIGGLAGLAIGLPVWLANDNPPPLFAAGIGAVLGSIYFGVKGMNRDKEIAVQKVRYLRQRESDLVKEKEQEEERLRKIEAEKERLKQQLEQKKKEKGESESGQH